MGTNRRILISAPASSVSTRRTRSGKSIRDFSSWAALALAIRSDAQRKVKEEMPRKAPLPTVAGKAIVLVLLATLFLMLQKEQGLLEAVVAEEEEGGWDEE